MRWRKYGRVDVLLYSKYNYTWVKILFNREITSGSWYVAQTVSLKQNMFEMKKSLKNNNPRAKEIFHVRCEKTKARQPSTNGQNHVLS